MRAPPSRCELVEYFLAQQRVRLAIPEISGRRSDQFGNLMAVLKLGAVNLDYRTRVAHQAFRGRFYRSGFTGSSRSQTQEVTDGPPRTAHSYQLGLVNLNDLL